MIDKEKLFNISLNFREGIEVAKQKRLFHPKSCLYRFPRACCEHASSLLRFYLKKVYKIDVLQVCCDCGDNGTHAFLEYGNLIIDITSDQFPNRPPVYVDYPDDFYKNMKFIQKHDFYDFVEEVANYGNNDFRAINLEDYLMIIETM